MKVFFTLLATLCALIAQTCVFGLNGLTLCTIPITLYLGLNIAEKISEETETKEETK